QPRQIGEPWREPEHLDSIQWCAVQRYHILWRQVMGTGHCLEVLPELSTVANRDFMLASRRRGGRIERTEALRHLLREGFERGLGRGHDIDLKRIVVERDRARGRHHVTDAG